MSHKKNSIYQSKIRISERNLPALIKAMEELLSSHVFVTNKKIKRKIFLDKLPDAILKRKSSRKRRLQAFAVAIDILKNSKNIEKNPKKKNEFSFCGLDKNQNYVEIHVREEYYQKDKKLQFTSCFWKEKKTSTH